LICGFRFVGRSFSSDISGMSTWALAPEGSAPKQMRQRLKPNWAMHSCHG
jgi:hypothetical protein